MSLRERAKVQAMSSKRGRRIQAGPGRRSRGANAPRMRLWGGCPMSSLRISNRDQPTLGRNSLCDVCGARMLLYSGVVQYRDRFLQRFD